MLAAIDDSSIDSNVSIKLTQFGLEIDPELAYQNARRVVEDAARRGNFVRIDMEASNVTQATLDVFKRLRAEFGLNDVGIVLQSYLYRTMDDARALLQIPARIRICKGAYNAPQEVAYTGHAEVDRSYARCLRALMRGTGYPMLATHDPRLIEIAGAQARLTGRGQGDFEYQMLYGIRPAEQRRLAAEGARMRVYLPYGKEWYPYLVRRLAERPAIIGFFVRTLLSEALAGRRNGHP